MTKSVDTDTLAALSIACLPCALVVPVPHCLHTARRMQQKNSSPKGQIRWLWGSN